jgi:hypothetical protein
MAKQQQAPKEGAGNFTSQNELLKQVATQAEKEPAQIEAANEAEETAAQFAHLIEEREKAEKRAEELAKELEKAKANRPANAEDALVKAHHLMKIGERLKAMQTKRDELKTYNFSVSDSGEGLIFKDAAGNTFQTTNQDLLAKVKNLILQEIEKGITKAQQEILELAS